LKAGMRSMSAPTSGKELITYFLKMAIDLEQAGDAQTDPAFKADLLARAEYSRQLAAKEAEKLDRVPGSGVTGARPSWSPARPG
jgi:hypothetical protein